MSSAILRERLQQLSKSEAAKLWRESVVLLPNLTAARADAIAGTPELKVTAGVAVKTEQ
jgi:hypothetical protein